MHVIQSNAKHSLGSFQLRHLVAIDPILSIQNNTQPLISLIRFFLFHSPMTLTFGPFVKTATTPLSRETIVLFDLARFILLSTVQHKKPHLLSNIKCFADCLGYCGRTTIQMINYITV